MDAYLALSDSVLASCSPEQVKNGVEGMLHFIQPGPLHLSALSIVFLLMSGFSEVLQKDCNHHCSVESRNQFMPLQSAKPVVDSQSNSKCLWSTDWKGIGLAPGSIVQTTTTTKETKKKTVWKFVNIAKHMTIRLNRQHMMNMQDAGTSDIPLGTCKHT